MWMTQPNIYKGWNTPCRCTYKSVQLYKSCLFGFWQPSGSKKGLVEGPVHIYCTIQEAEYFFYKMYGSKPAHTITSTKRGQPCLFRSWQATLSTTSKFAPDKFTPGRNHGMDDGKWYIFFPNSHYCLLFKTFVWSWQFLSHKNPHHPERSRYLHPKTV